MSSPTEEDDLSATVASGTLRSTFSVMSPRAALGRSIRITAEAVLEAIGYNNESDDDGDDYEGGVYHRPMEVLEAVAETPRPLTARVRGVSFAPARIAEIGQSYVERWDTNSAAAMELLRSELRIDQKLMSIHREEEAEKQKAEEVQSRLRRGAASTQFRGIAPSACLPPATLEEVEALDRRCGALLTATGIAGEAAFDEDVLALHKRIQLLDSLYAEETANRCDATITAVKRRLASKGTLLKLVGDTTADQQKMHQLRELTKVVADAHGAMHGALKVIGRMRSLRGVHREAYFRATTLAEIAEEMAQCDAMLKVAPEELEEMKPMIADISAAVKESLDAFRQRIKAIPGESSPLANP